MTKVIEEATLINLSDLKIDPSLSLLDEQTYQERVAGNSVINLCQNKTDSYKEYDNTFENLLFYHLNQKGEEGQFNAVLIDEADAFTLNMKDLCILPKEVMKGIISGKDIEAIKYFRKQLNDG